MTENHYVPARMVNEFAYCPRLFYLEWVQGQFAHSAETLDGAFAHRRVDQEKGELPGPGEVDETLHARSVTLSSERLGAIAKLDLIEADDDRLVPVEYKRGETPSVPEGAWEPERVQVCLQGLILRDNGYESNEGVIYFRGSRQRVNVPFTDRLVTDTERCVQEALAIAESGQIPPPLVDSPKCVGCSLVGICLPDEVHDLAQKKPAELSRRLIPARDDALPVYVQAQGATVGKRGDVLVVKQKGETVAEARLFETSQLAVFGNVQISSQVVRELCQREVPICYFSTGGWFTGMTQGIGHKNVELRLRQFETAQDEAASLAIAKRLVWGKIKNTRTLLRRNAREPVDAALLDLNHMARAAERAESAESLLGIEGNAARIYFACLNAMIRPESNVAGHFDFNGRNRRPPRDPVNALLSFVYAILVKDLTVTLSAVGFDPYLGFFHRPRYGRPALALDLTEEFRPLIGDSVVIGMINNGEIAERDFLQRGGAVALTPSGRAAVLDAYERRMDLLVTHPVFGYSISYRRVLEIQARLLGRWLTGEISEYPSFRTR